MHSLKAFRTLGLTHNSRRHRMRGNILKTAELFRSMGMDTRIPLLKLCFTDEPVQNRATAGRGNGVLVPEWKEGEAVGETSPEMAMRFNIFNAERGIQLVYDSEKKSAGVRRCRVGWLGDLRVVELLEGRMPRAEAHYSNIWYEIILGTKKDNQAVTHELEHAKHGSLAVLSGFGLKYPEGMDSEYLSLLAELINERHAVMANVVTETWKRGLCRRDMLPHICASFVFCAKLLSIYGMSLAQVNDAADASYAGKKGSHNPNLERMVDAGKEEYRRAYLRLFGLSLGDIREIVANLPMI